MPLYMDHHKNLEGLTAEAVAEDHKKDLEVQDKHGAKALQYWFSEEKGEVYCLFEAPNAEAAEAVHREAHAVRRPRARARAELRRDLRAPPRPVQQAPAGGACGSTGSQDWAVLRS